MKLYKMLQEVYIDEASNFFNILFKNKLQYKLVVIFYLFVFQESIGEKRLLIQALIMVKYLFFKYFCKYPRVPVDTRGYEKNRRVPA